MQLKLLVLLACLPFVLKLPVDAKENDDELYAKLNDPEKGRTRILKMGRSKDKKAPKKLIEFYRSGTIDDARGYYTKNEILLALFTLADDGIKDPEALALGFEVLPHENRTLFESAVRLICEMGQDTQETVGKRLLAFAEENKDEERIFFLVWGLGKLKFAPAIDYLSKVYAEQKISKGYTGDYVVAMALADIASPHGLDTLMTIYLKTRPLNKQESCLDGEPIVPCLMGLRKISGKDFGDDRNKWQEWYKDFKKMQDAGDKKTRDSER